ncbi:MAG: TonB-dependent receptor [Bacteroidales bacterium]|jgi:hemoglobin/transferrin/lactoferrin receptor protein|nr:TonB-dependent receptor [Bacteroidales bacterium]MCI2121692.1 TonB-dependent receptor [Bacteroidales bacterium]MCI2144883.1 TonB-dependent receptor [Bacteroidales bacterium]
MNNTKFRIVTVALAAAISLSSFGQTSSKPENAPDTLSSTDKPVELGQAVVTSFRVSRKVMEMPASLNVTGAFDYQDNSAFTVANVLNTEPGVYMGGDGIWATSINVRGLGEERLVTLVDGDRIETATDLTASLSMIDVNDIERVEVIKGAQSSLYGTGAMGGIINIITKDGHFADKPYVSGNLISGYATANKYSSNYLSVNAGSRKWYLKLSGTLGNAGDMMTPEGTLKNSQFNTNNISAKAGFKPFRNHLFKIQFQRNWSTNVGIPGGSAFPTTATATYKDIGRTLFDASYEITNLTDWMKSLKLSYFHQNIIRDVIMYPNSVTETTLANGNIQRQTPDSITPNATHLTNGLQLQGTLKLSDNNTLIVGADAWRRNISSDRTKYVTVEVLNPEGTVLATNKVVRGETPLPTASFTSTGIYAQDEAHLLDNRLTIITGARADAIHTVNDTVYNLDYTIVNGNRNDNPAGKSVTFDAGSANSFSWSANAGILYKVADDVDLTLNLARSFRAPSLEERYKYIDLGSVRRLGNPDLKPEDGYSADLGFRVWKDGFNMQASAYVNRITNMIVEAHGDTIDGVATLVNSNIGKALLYGFDLKAEYNITNNLSAYLVGSYVRGIDTENNTNLPAMPPLNGRLGIRYTYHKIGSAEFRVVGAAKQDRIATGETSTDGYLRYDMSLCTRRFDFMKVCSLQMFAGIDNITNVAYTNHLSTNRGDVSIEPGRNFFIRLNFGF